MLLKNLKIPDELLLILLMHFGKIITRYLAQHHYTRFNQRERVLGLFGIMVMQF